MAELPGQGTYWVTERLAERPIVVGNDKIAPRTIIQALQDTVKAHGNKNALFAKINGAWRSWTWAQYYADICKAARALISLGIKEGDAVSIIGFNSFEWLVADVATIAAGGIAAGIYTTNQAEACKYIVNHSESIVVFCEDNRHLAKFLSVKSDLTTVKAYVVWGEEPNVKADDIMSWAAFMKLGEGNTHQATLDARMAGLKPTRCCTLIYTSGTTGNPKACMISHDNMVWTSTAVGKVISAGPQDRTISYLPLSHIAAQMLDIVLPIVWASELHFAQPDALRGSLPQTLQEVRPTLFLGVPRVWEKVEAKLREVVRTATGLKKSLLDWALEIGRDSHRSMQVGGDTRWGFSAANFLVWSKVRAQLGFDQLRGAYSAAAPISKDTLEFFNGLNIPVYEIYGMSESSGPQTVSFEGHVKTGTVGPTFPGAETRIDRPDANGDGEICMRGRHIMMGYLNNPQATAETIDKDGWLHSGDVGRVDAAGFLAITGRIKELIITAGGENIPPVLIENELKLLLGSVVSNVMVIGDRMKFLSAVFTLQTKPNLQSQPGQYPFFDDLTDAAVATLSALGSQSTTLTAALKDDVVKKYIQDGINKYNNNATSRAQGIRKFFIAPSDFSIEGDELTATMKLKRRVVLQKYAKEIEAMYEGDAE